MSLFIARQMKNRFIQAILNLNYNTISEGCCIIINLSMVKDKSDFVTT